MEVQFSEATTIKVDRTLSLPATAPPRANASVGRGQVVPTLQHLQTAALHLVPATRRLLQGWRAAAAAIPEPALRSQALDSIHYKSFHCYGGAMFAVPVDPRLRRHVLAAIVALQTISDYLDNLCDRGAYAIDEDLFRTMHLAFMDALLPASSSADAGASRWGEAPLVSRVHRDAAGPWALDDGAAADHYGVDDGGYLAALVAAARFHLGQLPQYPRFVEQARRNGSYYVELQVRKHLSPGSREESLIAWHRSVGAGWPGLPWWEFAAASGSTLSLFAAFAAGAGAAEIDWLEAYFPWVGRLHILLDYWIDQEEDELGGDLSLVAPYGSVQGTVAAITAAFSEAQDAVAGLSDPTFHRLILNGLLALYLSDAKAGAPRLSSGSEQLLALGGREARALRAAMTGLRGVVGRGETTQPPPVRPTA